MSTKKGWGEELMMSAYTKEATYDAGVTMNADNACLMENHEVLGVDWPDVVETDKEEQTGTEHGTDQVLVEQRCKFNYSEPKAKPNTLALLAGLVMGSITTTKDGAEDAWKHKIVPVTVGTALPSMQLEHKQGGIQHAYKGVKGSSLEMNCDAGGILGVVAELLGSGTRATSATAFVAAISESWMMAKNCKVWMESGANIEIAAALTQHTEDISSATPEDLKARLRSFNVKFLNNPEELPGFGGAGVLQDIDYARRAVELAFSLQFNDITELNHFINQDPMAIEFDIKGAQITGASTMYYGAQIIIPRFKIKKAPHPQGGPNDTLTIDLECDVQDDGTNAALIVEVYNAKDDYLA